MWISSLFSTPTMGLSIKIRPVRESFVHHDIPSPIYIILLPRLFSVTLRHCLEGKYSRPVVEMHTQFYRNEHVCLSKREETPHAPWEKEEGRLLKQEDWGSCKSMYLTQKKHHWNTVSGSILKNKPQSILPPRHRTNPTNDNSLPKGTEGSSKLEE